MLLVFAKHHGLFPDAEFTISWKALNLNIGKKSYSIGLVDIYFNNLGNKYKFFLFHMKVLLINDNLMVILCHFF